MRAAHRWWRCIVLLAVVATGSASASDLPRPIVGYGSLLLRPAHGAVRDIAIIRLRDGARRVFSFDAKGARDTGAVTDFLGDGPGRVERVFDQFGARDLGPRPGTRGPMILAAVGTDGLPGLLFDNSGAFEGDVAAVGRPPYAVSLAAPGLPLNLSAGFTIIARMRLGNVVSIAGAQIWEIGSHAPIPLVFAAGWADPSRPESLAEDMTFLQDRNIDLSLPLPSTPSVFAVSADHAGVSALVRRQLTDQALPLKHDERWDDLLLGTTQPGAGAGFELDSLVVFDRKLSPGDMRAWAARLERHPAPGTAGTLVLDGSSVEAGVGSTGLRNQSRLYEEGLPDFEIDNVAVGGARTLDRIRALPATLRLLKSRPGTRILLCAVGANSLGTGVPPSVAYEQIDTYIKIARQAVPGLLVGLTTLIPSGYAIDLGHRDAFDAYNRLVRGNKAEADFIVDRAADPLMGDPNHYRPIDRRISADGGHPTDFGHARLADIDLAALHRALGSRAR